MSIIQVWSEGYRATGEHGTAHLMGEFEANNFDEAVEKMLEHKEKTDWKDIRKYYRKGGLRMIESKIVPHSDGHYIWACKLYNNETDARKFCG